MMFRVGWGVIDTMQKHILAIDIHREGFEWALAHSYLSHPPEGMTDTVQWEELKDNNLVRIH